MATHDFTSSCSSLSSDEFDATSLNEAGLGAKGTKSQREPDNEGFRKLGQYHKVLVLNCEDGTVKIRSGKEFAADRENQPKKYRPLYEKIPRGLKQVMVFVEIDEKKTPTLSANDKSKGRFWTRIRLDRLGAMDSVYRWLGGPRHLYVQNENSLKGVL